MNTIHMSRLELYEQAIKFRKQGKSYGQIKEILGISKSTLGNWLKKHPLTENQIKSLKENNGIKIERFRQTMLLKKKTKLLHYKNEQREILFPFSSKELFLSGVFLYWGEGNKASSNTLSINNTDPNIIRFALFWMQKSLDISREKIKVYLHLYSDMDINHERRFWSQTLKISEDQFAKVYIKKSKRSELTQKGFGHGTCGLSVNNTVIKEKILMSIEAIGDSIKFKNNLV